MVFSYFGSKSKTIKSYPPPLYDTIIEPFAGSARYAVRYYQRDVWINDLSPTIYGIWKWIQEASPKDVRDLPDLQNEVCLRDMPGLLQPVRDLLGFCVVFGSPTPAAHKPTKWSISENEITLLKSRLLRIVGKIDHWRITNSEYAQIVFGAASWYIDPPYQHGGKSYPFHKIDYKHLGQWCLDRKGQVIVCETTKADWLPFRGMKTDAGLRGNLLNKKQYQEAIWYRTDRKTGFGLL